MCTWHHPQDLIYINSINPHGSLGREILFLSHFSDENATAQGNQDTCQRSENPWMTTIQPVGTVALRELAPQSLCTYWSLPGALSLRLFLWSAPLTVRSAQTYRLRMAITNHLHLHAEMAVGIETQIGVAKTISKLFLLPSQ